MLIHLQKQATTTPMVPAKIQASDEPASVLAERFGTTEQTVYYTPSSAEAEFDVLTAGFGTIQLCL